MLEYLNSLIFYIINTYQMASDLASDCLVPVGFLFCFVLSFLNSINEYVWMYLKKNVKSTHSEIFTLVEM